MNVFYLLIYLFVLLVLFIAGFIVVGSWRRKGSVARALNMSLFLITMPRDPSTGPAQTNANKPEKEVIAVMEQLLSSFTNIHAKGWNKFLYGEPYIALEMAVHHVGEEIHFYAAVPKNYEQILEKQVHGFFPTAEVAKVPDYNIFNPVGMSTGAYLTLKNNPLLPIRTYQHLESDPLNELATSLSKLKQEGEGAAIQILIRPSHQKLQSLGQKVIQEMIKGIPFQKALYSHKEKKKTENQQSPANPVTPIDQEIIKSIQAKVGRPLFDVNLRLIASAPDITRAGQILNDVSGSLVQFSDPNGNGFNQAMLKGRSLDKFLFSFSFRTFDNRQSLTLSSEEITSLFHFPTVHTAAAKIKYLKAKPAEPPSGLPSQGLILGRNVYRGVETLVRMTDEDRRRHLYIIGQTGTGKTNLMKAMSRQDLENGKGVCVIDPHGDFAEFILSVMPPERAEDVIYFDPGEIDYPLGLNMLETDPAHSEQKSMVIDELFVIFDTLYNLKETGGPMFEKYFKNSAYLLIDNYEYAYRAGLPNYKDYIPVLADISRVLVDDKFRDDLLSREENPLVKQFWRLEAEQATGDGSLANMAPYISSKITSFIFNEYLRPIINQKESAFNMREAMDQGKILVVNLSKGKIGELNANLLGMVLVNKMLMAALSRVDIADEKQRRDFYLYIDEFQNFTTNSIAIILSEARKYHLDLIIAHQFIKQLKDNIRDAVFGNVGSIAAFRIGPDDAEFMKNKFEPVFSTQDLVNIDNLNAYINLLINGQPSRPFNIVLETERVFGAGSSEMTQYLKALSRSKYGRPRHEIEQEIMARFENKVSSGGVESSSTRKIPSEDFTLSSPRSPS